MDMQVILSDEVPGLGKVGDVVKVKAGYGRNYLIPRQLAVLATTRNVAQVEHTRRRDRGVREFFPALRRGRRRFHAGEKNAS